MTEPHAFLTIEYGAATTSVALIGRARGAWRLIGRFAMPADTEVDPAIDLLLERTLSADPDLAAGLGLIGTVPDALARLEVRSRRPRRMAVIAGAERTLSGLVATAGRSGWRPSGASADTTDPIAMSRLLLDHDVSAILVGAGDPPRSEERSAIRELAALVAAVAVRRPELPIVLSGAMSEGLEAFGEVASRSGEIVLAPAVAAPTMVAAAPPGRPRDPVARAGPARRRPAPGARGGDPRARGCAGSAHRGDRPRTRRIGPRRRRAFLGRCRGQHPDRGRAGRLRRPG
ncbi:MAG: hypothetical protein ACXW4T_02940 [Candidatus Limnocylindrales bacterium]